MARFCAITVLVAALTASSCSKNAPSPPSSGSSSSPIPIRGTERLTWDQAARDGNEVATIGYVLYIDGGTRVVLDKASCDPTSGTTTFVCGSPLPGLSAGTHTLELTSFFVSDPSVESARSAPLTVTLAQGSSLVAEPTVGAARPAPNQAASAPSEDIWPEGAVRLIDGVDHPTDLAFTPDGRLWIAERAGRIRVAHDDTLVDSPALAVATDRGDGTGTILALAVDPQFARTRFIFAIYTARNRTGALAFTIARFREASDTLADGVVILDDVIASADPHASLRFGPDAKLYAAFDDGGDERLVDDASSYNGKILRLNPDGTTPDDSPTKSPILMKGAASPRGLGWHERSARLWIADALHVGPLDWAPPPSGLAASEDALFVASTGGLSRAAFDPRNPVRLGPIDPMLTNMNVRAVVVSPDGAVYFATEDAIGVLAR